MNPLSQFHYLQHLNLFEILKWIFGWPGYLFPWLSIYLAMAVITYLFFYPSLTETVNFNLSWTSQIF